MSERLALLEPAWHANTAAARARLDDKLEVRPIRWPSVLAYATAAALLLALAFPAPRAIAQRVWDRLVVNRVGIVRLDLSRLPLKSDVSINGPIQPVKDLAEAERLAGFLPHLPPPGLLPGEPQLGVTGHITLRQSIQVRDIEAALAKAGTPQVRVPAEWDGATFRAALGLLITASYPGAELVQSPPIELFIPAGLSLEHFMEVMFQTIGVPLKEANLMGRTFAANPAWLLDLPPGAEVKLREIQLRSARGLLIEEWDDKGQPEVTIVWSTHERVYAVSGKTADLAERVAASLP